MSYQYMGRDKYQISYAIGPADLTAFDNAQDALLVGELNAIDWFMRGSVKHTKPKTYKKNPATAGHIEKRLSAGRNEGRYSPTHFLQTGIFTYAVMGACTTTEATPNIHAITKATTTLPIRLAFHLEKEGDNVQRRKDVMGFIPKSLDIYVSEQTPVAYQTYTGIFAFSGAGGNLALPAQLSQSIHNPYTWFHTKNASGASSYLYNTAAINDDIVSYHLHLGWKGNQWGPYDSSGYRTEGTATPPFDSFVELGVMTKDYTDTDSYAISDVAPESYAGDLDLIVDFYESATRYLKYTWDDMYIDPDSFEEVFADEGSWYDGVTYKLEFRNETGSVACEEKNALNNDYYENP